MAEPYYRADLAWIHHTGYSRHVENVAPGMLNLLRAAGVSKGARVLDVGCGSGLLARRLVDAGFLVQGIDASPAMIALAREHATAAEFDVVRLPAGRSLGEFDAVVSTGHVLNYLDSREAIGQALGELACAVRDGGVLALDLMTPAFRRARAGETVHARVADDWTIVTRFACPEPDRFDRDITVFRRAGDLWRRTDEHHRNVMFEAEEALRVLRDNGVDAKQRTTFGEEQLPEGLVVLAGQRRT